MNIDFDNITMMLWWCFYSPLSFNKLDWFIFFERGFLHSEMSILSFHICSHLFNKYKQMFVDRPLVEKDNALIVSNTNMDFETNQMLKESKDVKI